MKFKKKQQSRKSSELKKRKSFVRAEDAFLAKYTPEVIQSALERNARIHPPTYQCPRCKLHFKDLLAYAPHTRFFNNHHYCRSVKHITASGRFKQITYTDDFFLQEHTCIVLQKKEVPDTDNEVTEEESKKTDVDRRIVPFNRDDYEYRPLQSHWSEPDPQTGEVFMAHPNEYHRYRQAIDHQDEQRRLNKTERDLNRDEFISFKKMVTNWLDSQPSVLDCDFSSQCPHYIRVINTEFKLTPTEQAMHDEWVDWMKSQGIEVK
jgi:hypothetical protein